MATIQKILSDTPSPTSSNLLSGDLNLLTEKVNEQDQLIKLVLTQIDVQNEKLTKHELLIQSLQEKIQDLQSHNTGKVKNNKEVDAVTDWTNANKDSSNVGSDVLSVADMVKQTAEETMAKSGFIYDEASGLYLDYASGYYYDPVQSLYYNGHTGTYYTYDAESQKYVYHSQVNIPTKNATKAKKSKTRTKSWANKTNEVCESKEKFQVDVIGKGDNSPNNESSAAKHDSAAVTPVLVDSDIRNSLPIMVKIKNEDTIAKSDDDTEEGEISDSVGSPASSHGEDSECSTITSDISESDHAAETQFPPCIRAIVVESDTDLKKGHLFIVTCTGGSIGSEGTQHSILIPDKNIEKHHAEISYIEENSGAKYIICDKGSRSGTFLDGKRLSDPTKESDPCEILHGSKLSMGNTLLLLHIHPGLFTCGHCEPGLIIEKEPHANGPVLTKEKKESLRKSEMRKLQKKYGVSSIIPDKLSSLSESYQDRAQQRRLTKGSDNPFEKTEIASVDQALKESNKGFKMMSKMGWKEGCSLGNSGEDGIKEPIKLNIKSDRRGLGSTSFTPQVTLAATYAASSSQSMSTGKGNNKPEPKTGDYRTKTSRTEILDKTFKRFKECANEDQK